MYEEYIGDAVDTEDAASQYYLDSEDYDDQPGYRYSSDRDLIHEPLRHSAFNEDEYQVLLEDIGEHICASLGLCSPYPSYFRELITVAGGAPQKPSGSDIRLSNQAFVSQGC
jgi:hypothetical protein